MNEKGIPLWYPHSLMNDPDRTRTYNQLIKSQLLCQLSYGAIDVNYSKAVFPVKSQPPHIRY